MLDFVRQWDLNPQDFRRLILVNCVYQFHHTPPLECLGATHLLDTTLASGLFHLRKITGAEEGNPALADKNDAANLAVRNLLRGYALRMPTGQAVARKIKQEVNHPVHVLTPNELLKVARESGNKNQEKALKDGNFHQRTPL